jgi:hypothetical protein
MTTGLFRNVVLARAMLVEPITRVICADPIDADTRPFAHTGARWQAAACRAAQSSWRTTAHAAPIEADDADLP